MTSADFHSRMDDLSRSCEHDLLLFYVVVIAATSIGVLMTAWGVFA